MNNRSLAILFNNIPIKSKHLNDIDMITFGELVSWVKNKTVINHFFKYKEVSFITYRFEIIPWPFFNAALMRLLCRGKCYFEDVHGKQQRVTVALLISLLFQMIRDYFKKGLLVNEVNKEVDMLLELVSTKSRNNKLDLNGRPVYLRTDLWFGVSAGGSVGHIAGVLNNLDKFSGSPVFLTTDFIPTVTEEIEKTLVFPEKHFRDFRELSIFNFNRTFNSCIKDVLSNMSISFIYQRYSINNYCGVKLAHEKKLPFVLEFNGSEVWITRNWGGKPLKYEELSQKIEMLNLQAADLIVVVSKPLKDELTKLGINAEKILVNPNGVDTNKYSPKVDGNQIREKYDIQAKIVLGFIGTFGLWHGAEILAEAFGRLLNQYPEYRDKVVLLMIGDGITMPKVKSYLDRHNVVNESILTGIVPQKEGPQYLAACDILVSPHVPNSDGSPFFGSPTKLFEYMAMGKGIVASNLDQIGEILEHEKTAWMVTPGDVDNLVEGLKTLIDNKSLRESLGTEARKRAVEAHTWHEHTRKIINSLQRNTVCK